MIQELKRLATEGMTCLLTEEIEKQTDEWLKGDMARNCALTRWMTRGMTAWMMHDLMDGLKGKDETDSNRPDDGWVADAVNDKGTGEWNLALQMLTPN